MRVFPRRPLSHGRGPRIPQAGPAGCGSGEGGDKSPAEQIASEIKAAGGEGADAFAVMFQLLSGGNLVSCAIFSLGMRSK